MQNESHNPQAQQSASEPQANLLMRGDTILGVCEGLGQDFGINPNWLRVVFAASFYWSPVGVIGAYLALGVLVASSRLLFPTRRSASASTAATADLPEAPSEVTTEQEQQSLPLAA